MGRYTGGKKPNKYIKDYSCSVSNPTCIHELASRVWGLGLSVMVMSRETSGRR